MYRHYYLTVPSSEQYRLLSSYFVLTSYDNVSITYHYTLTTFAVASYSLTL
jgi:hypothetical protein